MDDPCTHKQVDKGDGEDIVSIFTYLKGIGYIDRRISKTTGKPETIERVIVSMFKNYSEFYHTFLNFMLKPLNRLILYLFIYFRGNIGLVQLQRESRIALLHSQL